MHLHVSSTFRHHQEAKITLHNLWYHHTYRLSSRAQVERVLSQPVHETASQPVHETASEPVHEMAFQPVHEMANGCVMQF